MVYICKFCTTEFATKSNLNAHQKTAKYCLQLRQTVSKQSYNCFVCNKNFSSKQYLDIHTIKCQEKIHCLNSNMKIRDLEKCNVDKDKYIIKLETDIEHLKETVTRLEKELQEFKEQQKQDHKILLTKATNSSNTTIKNNTIIQNLLPLTDEYMREQAQYLTLEHINQGAVGIAKFALEYPLKDRVICTDVSRKKLKYKDTENNLIEDPGGIKITQKLCSAIHERNSDLIKLELKKLIEEDEDDNSAYQDLTDKYNKIRAGIRAAMNGDPNTEFALELVGQVCKTVTS